MMRHTQAWTWFASARRVRRCFRRDECVGAPGTARVAPGCHLSRAHCRGQASCAGPHPPPRTYSRASFGQQQPRCPGSACRLRLAPPPACAERTGASRGARASQKSPIRQLNFSAGGSAGGKSGRQS
eukprot:scaffold13765_cov64-Phaeocystis_antarctica.AAC.11